MKSKLLPPKSFWNSVDIYWEKWNDSLKTYFNYLLGEKNILSIFTYHLVLSMFTSAYKII